MRRTQKCAAIFLPSKNHKYNGERVAKCGKTEFQHKADTGDEILSKTLNIAF